MIDDIMTSGKGARNGIPRVGVLLTYGPSSDLAATREAAKRAHEANIKLIVVAVNVKVGHRYTESRSHPANVKVGH